MADLIAVIAAITALCAVLLGPLVSLWAANKQVRISLRSNNRQEWINSLRKVLADFSSTARVVALAREFEDKYARSEKLYFLEEQLNLMLNPAEEDHKSLLFTVRGARKAAIEIFAAGQNEDEQAKREAHNRLKISLAEVTKLAQPILKREWERVKKAE